MGRETKREDFKHINCSKFDEKSQNYSSIKVHVKWSLGECVSLPEILRYVNLWPLGWIPIFVTSKLKIIEE